MPWLDDLWKDYVSPVLDTSLSFTAYSFEIAGSLANIVSGVIFSMSSAARESLQADYYGQTSLRGDVDLEITIKDLFRLNETIPYTFSGHETGGLYSNLEHYIGSYQLNDIAMFCWLTGVSLNIIASNIKVCQNNKHDALLIQDKLGKDIKTYIPCSYALVSFKALMHSSALSFYSSAAASAWFQHWIKQGGHKGITYPPHSDNFVKSSAYNGPVDTISIPIDAVLTHNQSTVLPIIPIPITLEQIAHIKGILNFTYGGGVSLKPSSSLMPEIIGGSFAGLAASSLSFFAGAQLEKKRNERLLMLAERDSKQPLLDMRYP